MFQRRSVQRSNISIFKGNSGPQNPKFLIGPATNIQGKHTNTQGNTSQKKRKNNRQQGQLNPRPQKKLFIIGKSFKAIQGRRRGKAIGNTRRQHSSQHRQQKYQRQRAYSRKEEERSEVSKRAFSTNHHETLGKGGKYRNTRR